MKDGKKTKKQLIDELEGFRRQVAALKRAEAAPEGTDETPAGSEEYYRLAMEHASDGVIIFRGNDCLYFNRKFLELTGCNRPEDIADKSLFDTIHPDDLEMAKEYARQRQQGEFAPFRHECRIVRPDGSGIRAEISSLAILHKGEPASFCFIRDITERKNTENALQEIRERYRTILENIEDGYYEVDITGRFTFLNESFLKIMGYSHGEVMRTNAKRYAADEEQARKIFQAYNSVYRTGVPLQRFEWDLLRKDGARRTVEISASLLKDSAAGPAGFRGIVRDTTERKLFEKSLLESEGKYRNIFENALEGIFQTTPEGQFITANQAMATMLGYDSPQELIATLTDITHQLYVHPEERSKILQAIQELDFLSGYEVQFYRRDGSVVWVTVNMRAIRDRDGNLLHYEGLNVDITERKQAEEALRFSEERYRSILDNMEEGYYEVDLMGSFTFFNRSMAQMIGYSGNEMAGMNYRSFMDNDVVRNVFRTFSEVYRTDIPAKCFDVELIREDAKRITVEISIALKKNPSGTPVGFCGVVRDITERKRAEEALRFSEERYRLLIETSRDLIYTTDRKGFLTYINPSFSKALGYIDGELQGVLFTRIVTPDFAGRVRDIFKRAMKGEIIPVYEAELIGKNGKRMLVEFNVSTLCDRDGKIAGRYGIGRDITEIRRAEKELRRSEWRKTILNRIAHTFLTVPDEEMYEKVLDIILELMKSKFGIFGYIAENGSLVVPSMTREIWNRCSVPDKSISFASDTWGNSLWGKALREKRAYLSDGPFHTPEGHIPVEHFLTVPIVFGERAIGLISIADKEEGYTEEDRDLLSGIVNYISPILNARLQRDIEERERKRAEEALQQNEAILRSVFKAAPVGLCIMKNRVYQSANKAWCESFGYSESELIGHTTRMLYENEEEYVRVGRELYASLSEHGLVSVQTRLRRKDGVFRDAIVTAAPLRSEDLALGTVVAIEDITDYKRTMEELEENRRRLADIIEFLPDATMVIDRDGRVIAWNRAMEEMTGVNAGAMLGKGGYEYAIPFYGKRRPTLIDLALHPDPEREKLYASTQRMGDVIFGEGYAPKLSPGNIHLSAAASVLRDSKGEIIAAIECIRNSTERKQSEEALRESEERYRQLFESESDAIFLIDNRTGFILEANSAARSLYGYSREELLTKRSEDLSAEPVDARLVTWETPLAPYQVVNIPLQFHRKKDGEEFPVEITSRSFIWKDRPVHIAAIRDITERKQAEQERRRLEERLQRAEKMESLGMLAGGVAHDLNNILGVMMGYSELTFGTLDEKDPRREYTRTIMKSSERAAAIVQDMLTLARRGVVTKNVINLNTVVADQLRTPEYMKLASYYPRVRVKTETEADLLNIKGSPVHLGKSLMNLLSNAAESIRGEGIVTIRTENRYLDGPVSGYDQVNAGDYVVLTVTDTGEGISPQDIKRIFEPFYTRKVMGRSGTGLGLAVVWGTVKDHDGYIDVKSRPGTGTVFTLYFPVTRTEAAEEVPVSPAEYMGRGETVLVVDDVREQREMAGHMLTRLNYRVIVASSGEEAVDYIEKHDAELIVLDMIMDPGMDGLETYRRIIKTKPGQKAVIVSGFAETERVREAQKIGAGPFVKKPYILEKIGLAVRRELNRK